MEHIFTALHDLGHTVEILSMARERDENIPGTAGEATDIYKLILVIRDNATGENNTYVIRVTKEALSDAWGSIELMIVEDLQQQFGLKQKAKVIKLNPSKNVD